MRKRAAGALVGSAIAAFVLACSVIAPDSPDLHIDNGTTLELNVLINDQPVGRVEPTSPVTWSEPEVPGLPWHVSVRTLSGRELLVLDVGPDSVSSTSEPDGHTSMSGAGARVDLSCGRLDAYAGPPMVGPMPGPGVPGDCAP